MSRHAPLVDETILDAIGLQTDTIWGCRWGEQTRFAVLDIDATSQYHNELGLARLRHLLASVGLNFPQIYQSSDSEGWHLYLSFSGWVGSEIVHKTLKQWLAAEGLQIKQGQLELFPSNNGLRFPLQRGFAWLDDQGAAKLRREEITADQAIFKFVDALDANAHNWQIVQTRITSRLAEIELAAGAGMPAEELKNEDIEEDGFSAFFTEAGKIQEVYDLGREFWQNGLTAPGQRHQAILCIGHYLWYGDENAGIKALPGISRAERRAATIENWLKEKHNGFSESVLKGDWKGIRADISRSCNWTAQEGKETPKRASYSISDRAIDRLEVLTKQTGRVWYPTDFEKGNIGREEQAREQIRLALVQLLEEGRRVSVRGLERVSGCDRKTIRRHSDIWGIFRLSNGGGDLSFRWAAPEPTLVDSLEPPLSSESVQEVSDPVFSVVPLFDRSVGLHVLVDVSFKPVFLLQRSSLFLLTRGPPVFVASRLERCANFFRVFDSLCSQLSGAMANNSTATIPVDLLAATHSKFSYGVKHRFSRLVERFAP